MNIGCFTKRIRELKSKDMGWEFEIVTFDILLKNSVDYDFLISKLNKIIIQWFRKVKINFDTETEFRHPNKNFDFKTKFRITQYKAVLSCR
ncbi:hypothetical protein BpHYR1_008081, partial [Brachionus plicatilis]